MHKDEKGVMKIKNLAILLLLVFAGSAAAQTNDEIKAKTAEFAAEYLQQGGVGLMIGIIKDGGRIRCFGASLSQTRLCAGRGKGH
jgi:hypothetical protein